jgi:hypothetical protein
MRRVKSLVAGGELVKLQRLAGFGPIAALVSAGALFVLFVIEEFNNAILTVIGSVPYVTQAIVFFLLLWLWVAALSVATFDLEWIEHPRTSTPRLQVARGLTFIAMVMPAVLLLALLLNLPLIFQVVLNALTWGGVGISILVHNWEARRAGILHGVLPWLGIVSGVAMTLAGIGYALFVPNGTRALFFLIAINFLLLGQVLYMVWAIWLGVKLARSKVAALATLASPAHQPQRWGR